MVPARQAPPAVIWRPADEGEACANITAFIEWRRALAGHHLAGPDAVWAWAAAAPAAFHDALLGFAGPPTGVALLLGRRVTPPEFDRATLGRLAADHLLRLGLRPDQTVLWPGPRDDPWPFGALLAGCTLLLCETPPADPEALAAAEGALLLRRPA